MSFDTVNLKLSWKGSLSYEQNWHISFLDIKMKDPSHKISAYIDADIPAIQEQRLNFRIKKIDPSICEEDEEEDDEDVLNRIRIAGNEVRGQ